MKSKNFSFKYDEMTLVNDCCSIRRKNSCVLKRYAPALVCCALLIIAFNHFLTNDNILFVTLLMFVAFQVSELQYSKHKNVNIKTSDIQRTLFTGNRLYFFYKSYADTEVRSIDGIESLDNIPECLRINVETQKQNRIVSSAFFVPVLHCVIICTIAYIIFIMG